MRLRRLLPLLCILGAAAGSNRAAATLLYAGGEDIDFICNSGGSCSVSTNSGVFRSSWAREAYAPVSQTAANDPPTNRFATPTFAANSTIWVHAQFCTGVGSCSQIGTGSNNQMLRILDSSGNPTLIVRGTGTNQQLKISSRTSAGVFTDLVTCSTAFNTSLTQVDLYVNYGASGEVTLYNNSAQSCDYTGNVTNGDGATTLDAVEFAQPTNTNNTIAYWSEVIVATTDTRAMARFTANTVGNGNSTGFSGTNVCSAIWNATAFNDSNYGYSGSNNVLHECTVNSSIPVGIYNVLGLVMSARALVGSSGPQHFDFLTRTSSTDYASSNFAPTNSFSNIANYIQTVNPATSNPWGVSDFQASGFNVGLETKP